MERRDVSAAFAELEPEWVLLFLAWFLAAAATATSLFFSEVLGLPPCVLCWYQRVFLFPLVLILARGLFPLDVGAAKFGLPLATAGWLTAAYHNLLFTGVIPAGLQPCGKGVSCTDEAMRLFGFLSIPMLSLLGFTALVGLLVAALRRRSV